MDDKYYCVYLVSPYPPGDVKIGFTSNFTKRHTTLQSANSKRLCMESLAFFDSKENALNAEKLLHKKLDHLRLQGEWFDNYALNELEKILPELVKQWCLENPNPNMPKEEGTRGIYE